MRIINSIKMTTKLDVNQTEQILPLMVPGLDIQVTTTSVQNYKPYSKLKSICIYKYYCIDVKLALLHLCRHWRVGSSREAITRYMQRLQQYW